MRACPVTVEPSHPDLAGAGPVFWAPICVSEANRGLRKGSAESLAEDCRVSLGMLEWAHANPIAVASDLSAAHRAGRRCSARDCAARESCRRGDKLHLATNAYSWQVFYQREGRNFGGSLDAGLKDVAASGLNGFEPGVGGTEDLRALLPLLKKHGLEMRSIYVNSSLHEPAEADRSIEQILATAVP